MVIFHSYGDLPMKNGDLPIKDGDLPIKQTVKRLPEGDSKG